MPFFKDFNRMFSQQNEELSIIDDELQFDQIHNLFQTAEQIKKQRLKIFDTPTNFEKMLPEVNRPRANNGSATTI